MCIALLIVQHKSNLYSSCTYTTLHFTIYTDPARVLKSNYKELVNGIQNADALAAALYTSEIIATNIRDKVHAANVVIDKNEILLKAIQATVSTSPDAYEVFRNEVLKEQPLLKNLLPFLDMDMN